LQRGLIDLGLPPGSHGGGPTPNDLIVMVFNVVLWLTVLVWVVDAFLRYVVKGSAAGERVNGAMKKTFRGADANQRMLVWWLVVAVLALLLNGTGAVTY